MGLRSVVYWSFVGCDDPKGVTECKTIRQSKKKAQNWNTYEEEVSSGVIDKQNSKSRLKQDSMESERRDCYDELRQVIRESFARNNLFHPKEDKPTSTPSTHNPNIIAKLMGLEQAPSKTFKQMDRFPNPRPRLFDIHLPVPNKPHFKGLVGSIDAKYAPDSIANFITKTPAAEGPPIVIMRPRIFHENYTVNSRTTPPKVSSALEVPKQKKINKDMGKIRSKNTLDRVSSPRTNKKDAIVEHTRKAAVPNTRKRTAVSENVGKRSTVKHSEGVRESNASRRQANEDTKRIPYLKSNTRKKNLRHGKPSAALVENDASQHMRTEQVMDSYCVSISEKSENTAISFEQTSKGTEDSRCISCGDSDETIRSQLSSSASFLNYVKELFDTAVVPTDHHSPEDDSLLIDCAKEILERKSLSWNPSSRKLLTISELVMEICEGIEHLRNYSDRCCGDRLCGMVERDLRWNEQVTGGWDLGWRKGYTTEAVDEVVRHIERLVLNEVVANVVVQFFPG